MVIDLIVISLHISRNEIYYRRICQFQWIYYKITTCIIRSAESLSIRWIRMVVLEVSIMGNLPMISCCFCISYLNKLSLVMFFNNEIPIKRNSDYLKLFSKFLNSIPLLPIINHVSWVKYCLFRRSDLKLKILIQIIIFQDLNQFLFFFLPIDVEKGINRQISFITCF